MSTTPTNKSSVLNLLFGVLIFFVQPLFVSAVLQKHTGDSVNIPLGAGLLLLIALEFMATKNKMKTIHKNYGTKSSPLFLWITHMIGSVFLMLYGLEAIFGETYAERAWPIMVAVMIKELVLLFYMFDSGVDQQIYANKPEGFTYTDSFWKTDFVIFVYSLAVHALMWGSIEANKETSLARPIPGDQTAALMIFLLNAVGTTIIFTLSYLASRPTVVYEDIMRVNKAKHGGVALFLSYVFVVIVAVAQVMS